MSLNIEKSIGEEVTVKIAGRLDTSTAPELEVEMDEVLTEELPIVLDTEGLEYISSAGLRIILKVQKAVNANGTSLKLVNVNEMIMDIFEVTGFSDILTIE